MAISNLNLNVRANTSRALADFNKFSRSLDNKFLISGLKLDIITGALDKITRDFNRAIGEQGLASGSSLRAAQNQAALLTQTFKGFASESALAIQRDIGTALNTVAVRAGGTMKDVQKTLAATPFISTRLSEDLRGQLTEGMLAFQRDMRRSGLGDNFSGVAQQFLMGRSTGMEMVQSGNAMESFIGSEIIKRAGGQGVLTDPLQRSQIILDIVNDPALQKQFEDMARAAMGFRIIFEDLNTYLFNTEKGVFGSLRKVIDAAGKPTTMFDEVEKLVKQVFDKDEGMFAAIGKTLKNVFGIGDPMRPFIDAVQFITKIFKNLTDYFNSSGFESVARFAKDIFDKVYGVFSDIFNSIKGIASSGLDEDSIIEGIRDISKTIKEYIQSIGEAIRNTDTSDETGAIAGIAGTILEEIGKSAVVLFKELLMTIIDKVPEIAMQVLPALNNGINAVLTEMFGELGGKVAKFVLGFVPGVGPLARASAVGDVTGGGGNPLSALAMGAGALLGPATLFGAAKVGRGVFGPREARMNLRMKLIKKASVVENVYNKRMRELYLPGAQRIPLTNLLSRTRNPNYFPSSENPSFSPSSPNPSYYPSSPLVTEKTSMFKAIPPFFSQERRRRDENIRQMKNENRREVMGRYKKRIIQPYGATTSAFRNYDVPEYLTKDPIDYSGYSGPIGPQPHGYDWAYDPRHRDATGQDYAPFIQSSYMSPRERETRRKMAVSDRYNRMYESGSLRKMSRKSKISSIASRFRPGKGGIGKAGLIAGGLTAALGASSLFGGPGANAQTTESDPVTGQMVPVEKSESRFSGIGKVLAGAGGGALTGAELGSILGPKGAAVGAVIGTVIGGIAPLFDKEVRDSIGKLFSDLGKKFSETVNWLIEGIQSNFKKLGNMIGSVVKGIGNALVSSVNASLTVLTLLPRLLTGAVQGLFNKLPDFLKPEWAESVIGGISSVANFQLPNFYEGKNYYGPSMALESRMSGRRPMVVNDGEFVIPKDGFPTLAGLVSNNLKSTERSNKSVDSTQINITLSVTANSVVADANELADALRDPVYKIINDAWTEATASNVLRSRIN